MQNINHRETERRLALYGGAFDPVHVAHLAVARCALEAADLDEVVFVPAAQSPLKAHGPQADDAARLEMLRLATQDEARFRVDPFEIVKGGTSYSLDTVQHFEAAFPGAKLFWILGGDQFAQLGKWHRVVLLARRVVFLVIARPGSDTEPPEVPGLRYLNVAAPLMEESSSEIRRRCAGDVSINGWVPESVEAFISANGLYRS